MTITVQIPTALRRHTAGTAKITCSAANLGELFTVLDQQFPDLKLPKSTLHRWYDITIAQVRKQVLIESEQARQFAAAMTAAGNRCDLVLLAHARHAFVVPRYRATESAVVSVLRQMDDYLISLKLLTGEPTLAVSQMPAWIPLAPATNHLTK